MNIYEERMYICMIYSLHIFLFEKEIIYVQLPHALLLKKEFVSKHWLLCFVKVHSTTKEKNHDKVQQIKKVY